MQCSTSDPGLVGRLGLAVEATPEPLASCGLVVRGAHDMWLRRGDGLGVRLQAAQTGLWMERSLVPPDADLVQRVIRRDATARRIQDKGCCPVEGDWVGVRLNLNILRSTGVCVHTLHRGGNPERLRDGRGFWDGEVLGYGPVVSLRDAWFSVQQSGREAIASGRQNKHPMASIDGQLWGAPRFDGVEVRFNPMLHHLFVDAACCAVRWAEEVTVLGHRAFLRGTIVYHDKATAPERKKGACKSEARLLSESALRRRTGKAG